MTCRGKPRPRGHEWNIAAGHRKSERGAYAIPPRVKTDVNERMDEAEVDRLATNESSLSAFTVSRCACTRWTDSSPLPRRARLVALAVRVARRFQPCLAFLGDFIVVSPDEESPRSAGNSSGAATGTLSSASPAHLSREKNSSRTIVLFLAECQ